MSEWKTDAFGRRYREIGKGQIEYAETIRIDGAEIYMDELTEYHRKKAQKAAEERAKAVQELMSRPAPAQCPFTNSGNNSCKREGCGVFYNGRCALAVLADGTAAANNTGGKCPFSIYARCERCALNNNGCAIVRLAAAKAND